MCLKSNLKKNLQICQISQKNKTLHVGYINDQPQIQNNILYSYWVTQLFLPNDKKAKKELANTGLKLFFISKVKEKQTIRRILAFTTLRTVYS